MEAIRVKSREKIQHQLDAMHDLQGIVKMMKTLAGANIRQYEHASRTLENYYSSIELGLRLVGSELENIPANPAVGSNLMPTGIIIFGTDHGLCGHINEHLVELALETKNPRVLTVGVRTANALAEAGIDSDKVFPAPASLGKTSDLIQQLLPGIDHWQNQQQLMPVDILFNHYLPDGAYHPVRQALLPVDTGRFRQAPGNTWPSHKLPGHSIAAPLLFGELLQQYFFISLFSACVESQTSEHSTRLRTMLNAEENIKNRIEEITAEFRRVRQAEITSELMEVLAGFEASLQHETPGRDKDNNQQQAEHFHT